MAAYLRQLSLAAAIVAMDPNPMATQWAVLLDFVDLQLNENLSMGQPVDNTLINNRKTNLIRPFRS